MNLKALILGAAVVFAGGPAFAGDATMGDLHIEGAWARASAGPVGTGAAFMTVVNTGSQPDQLIGATTEISAKAELHTHIKEGDVMRMRPVPAVELPAGQTVTLQPGGSHVMLFDLKKPLKQGESFPLTLKFAKAGSVTVTVDVQSAGSMGIGAQQHQMHGGMSH